MQLAGGALDRVEGLLQQLPVPVQVQHVHDHAGQLVEAFALLLGEVVRPLVEDAQGAQDVAVPVAQVRGGVEAHVVDLAGDERVAGEDVRRGSRRVRRRVSGSTMLIAHIESSRSQTPASKPKAAIWCWAVAEMMLTTAVGTPQM